MNEVQREVLELLCARYGVAFDAAAFGPAFDLPDGYVAGWVGDRIFVGCSPEGEIHS